MRARLTTWLLGASTAAMLLPAAAMAQSTPPTGTAVGAQASPPSATPNAPSANASDDQTVIVTARRRDEAIQDVPAVVNAVTSQEAAKLNFRNFTEVQTVVPGLSLTTNANGTGGNAQLRGVNFDINASGNNPTVEFYQNDAPITAGVVLQQIYDIGQIEVLRGPQGTLRGRASPSGSITVTTKTPDLYRAGGNLSLTGSSIGTMNVNGGIGIPIIEGKLGIRVAGVENIDRVNLVRTINPGLDGRRPYSESKSGRVTVEARPIDALRLLGSYEKFDRYARFFDQTASFSVSNPAAPASPVFIRPSDRLTNQETPETNHQIYDIYNGRAELALAGQRLIYQYQHYTQKIDSTLGQDYGNIYPNLDFPYQTSSRISSTSHEVRLQNEARVFDIFDYVVGFFDNKNNTPTNLNVTTGVFLPAFLGGGQAALVTSPIARVGQSLEKSVYGNLTAHVGTLAEISGGIRYINYKSSGALIVSGTQIDDQPINDNKVIYTASIKHNFNDHLLIYASTGSSYRPGIFTIGDFSVAQSALERSFLNLPAETSKSYEAGVKSTLLDGRLRLDVSGFHQTFKNFPYRVPGVSGQSGVYYINYNATVANGAVTVTPQVGQFNFVGAVPVTVNGVEGSADFQLSKNLSLNLVASYALGKINNGFVPCNDLNKDGVPDVITAAPSLAQLQAAYGANNLAGCRVNQRSSFQPPFSASAIAEYDRPVAPWGVGYLRGLLSYSGRSQSDPTNAYDNVGSYALLNLYIGVRDPGGKWEINAFAKNITDITKVLTQGNPLSTTVQVLQPPTFRTAAAQTTTSTYVGITTTVPREFGLNLRFNFGSR